MCVCVGGGGSDEMNIPRDNADDQDRRIQKIHIPPLRESPPIPPPVMGGRSGKVEKVSLQCLVWVDWSVLVVSLPAVGVQRVWRGSRRPASKMANLIIPNLLPKRLTPMKLSLSPPSNFLSSLPYFGGNLLSYTKENTAKDWAINLRGSRGEGDEYIVVDPLRTVGFHV